MTHLIVLGGFLGAGKTTTLLRLARALDAQGRRVAVITNDQAGELVDTALLRAAGYATDEVTRGCFCCHFDDFVARADRLVEAVSPDVILAEPVGSCTDIVATVLNPLRRAHGKRFTLAPFPVLVDPAYALHIFGDSPGRLSEKIGYIYRLQQIEGDVLVVNKVDRLSAEARTRIQKILHERFPGTRTLMFSAHTGEGFADLLTLTATPSPDAYRALDVIDYDRYADAEAALAWLNRSIHLRSRDLIETTAALVDLASGLQDACRRQGIAIGHAKFMAQIQDTTSVVTVTDLVTPPSAIQPTAAWTSAMHVLLNVRLEATPESATSVITLVVNDWCRHHGLTILTEHGGAFSPPPPKPPHRIPALK